MRVAREEAEVAEAAEQRNVQDVEGSNTRQVNAA